MPGFMELLLLLIIVVLIFGATKLPKLGAALGKTIKSFKQASEDRDEIEVSRVDNKKDLPPGSGE
jgi:sec-independent protein translocase protein TatA